jgi:hypothetical protein
MINGYIMGMSILCLVPTVVKRKNSTMTKYIGIWLDQEKAYIVTIEKENIFLKQSERENVTFIKSGVEKHIRLSGGSRTRKTPYGPQDIAVDGKIDARRRNQLDDYYERIN